MPGRLGAAAVLTALAVAATACGADHERGIRSAFSELRQAYAKGDPAAVCTLLSSAAQREVGELGHGEATACPRDLRRNTAIGDLSRRDRAAPAIREIEVDGDEATVVAVLGGTTPGVVHFVREDGEWKLAQLFGTTAPPPEDLQ